MLTVILKKIKNKKWLTMCMMLGITFLIATFSCFPMFEAGSIDVMIQNEFEASMESNNSHPMTMTYVGLYETEDYGTIEDMEAIIDEQQQKWEKTMGNVRPVNMQRFINMMDLSAGSLLNSKKGAIRIAYVPELEEHIKMLAGEMYGEDEDSEFTCIVPQSVVSAYALSVNEEFEFFSTTLGDSDKALRLRVAGFFDVSDTKDLFWLNNPNESDKFVYVSRNTFNKIAKECGIKRFDYSFGELFDYTQMNHKNMDSVQNAVVQLKRQDENYDINFVEVMKNYNAEKKTIQISIWVLQLPILGLVLGFIFMVSKQILDAERNEMAMLFSRGMKRKQIIFMYTAQSGVIATAAILIGLPLGYILCKIAACSKNFLSFSFQDTSLYKANILMLGYAIIAALVGLIVIVIPVFRYSKITIVEHKSAYSFKKKMVWQKFFLDVILLGVSIYLLYTYNNNKENVRINALTGSKMDPMIFVNTILFIVAAGLVTLRLGNYLVRFVYHIRRDKWKPATYASFLQITRNFSKQCFISVFLILTISMGIFYANAARTINGNHQTRIEYDNGSDVVVQEKWKANYFRLPNRKVDYEYVEPAIAVYEKMIKDGTCDSMAKVIRNREVEVKSASKNASKNVVAECEMMGINTKDFGETAFFRNEWNRDTHWFNYLNALSEEANGVIISRNLANALEIKIGDKIDCTRYGALADMKNEVRGSLRSKVVAIVDNWPGYDRYTYDLEGEKEQYLVVFNYTACVRAFHISPYEVWLRLNDKADERNVYKELEEAGIVTEYVNSMTEEKERLKKDCILQITNGLFTLSFIIAVILCSIGFLIYWIASISQRQLLFGIYRAMGMSAKEINGMLSNEHFFSTFLSVLSGVFVGSLASLLFTKLFALIYLPKRHNVALYIDYLLIDYVKLGIVIFVMIAVCLVCLRGLVNRMDISKSLKLGED